jgi:hypothetical protein
VGVVHDVIRGRSVTLSMEEWEREISLERVTSLRFDIKLNICIHLFCQYNAYLWFFIWFGYAVFAPNINYKIFFGLFGFNWVFGMIARFTLKIESKLRQRLLKAKREYYDLLNLEIVRDVMMS